MSPSLALAIWGLDRDGKREEEKEGRWDRDITEPYTRMEKRKGGGTAEGGKKRRWEGRKEGRSKEGRERDERL